MSRKTIAIDFDGVLNSYTSGWVAADKIPDPPLPDAITWLNQLQKRCRVYIFTTRAQTLDGVDAIHAWLRKWGANYADSIVVTPLKYAAHAYVDDRAHRYMGSGYPTYDMLTHEDRWGARHD